MSTVDLLIVLFVLMIKLIEMSLLKACHLPLKLLHFIHERLDLFLELLFKLFMQLCILFQLHCISCDGYLKLFSFILTLSEVGYILGDIIFEIIENVELLV